MIQSLRSIFWGIVWIAVISSTSSTQNVVIQVLGEKIGTIPDKAIREIENFLQNCSGESTFHIQGWRWHWLSLLRDSVRLNELTRRIGPDYNQDSDALCIRKAVEHVIFNYKALERIENQAFFPWLQNKFSNKNLVGNATEAFYIIINEIDREKQVINQIASNMKTELHQLEHNGVEKLTLLSSELTTLTRSIKEKQDRYIVPALSKIVPSKEQRSFNTKVLRTLGLLESRIHLVGMHDAVYDVRFGNEQEILAFESEIPVVAKKLIGRWKRTLYQPQAGALDEL